MSADRRCHCGSIMIPLFNFFACKAECDLPASMRTKPKAAPALHRPNVSLSFGGVPCVPAPPALWVPAVGDWVRVVDPMYRGAVYKITHQTAGGRWAGAGVTPGMYQFPATDIEPWKPRVGERVQIMQGYHQGDIGFVVRLSPCDITVAVAGADRFFGLSELEPA